MHLIYDQYDHYIIFPILFFDIHINEGIPSSAEELLILSRIKEALKSLTREQKLAGSLIEDPTTKEQVMYYSTSGHYAGPDE